MGIARLVEADPRSMCRLHHRQMMSDVRLGSDASKYDGQFEARVGRHEAAQSAYAPRSALFGRRRNRFL